MIKRKITDSIYEIYPGYLPPLIRYNSYSGDFFSFTVIGFNLDDIPFDFSIFETFKSQVRVGDPRSKKVLYEFENSGNNILGDEIVLGKSDEDQEEYDTLSIVTDAGADTFKFYPDIWIDIEGVINYGIGKSREVNEKYTIFKLHLCNEPDVTRS